jgi:uncharacterized protein YjiS (DUF1127 family)
MNSMFAMAESRQISSTAAITLWVGLMIMRVANRLLAAQNRARTRRILSGLDDASLRDIGLSRGQIDAVERDPRYVSRFPGA